MERTVLLARESLLEIAVLFWMERSYLQMHSLPHQVYMGANQPYTWVNWHNQPVLFRKHQQLTILIISSKLKIHNCLKKMKRNNLKSNSQLCLLIHQLCLKSKSDFFNCLIMSFSFFCVDESKKYIWLLISSKFSRLI